MSTALLDSPLARAKHYLTVLELGIKLYPGWKGGKSCHSPFREDKSPSFSVFADGRMWKDHATGDHGDAVDFIAKARGCTKGDAARELIILAGGNASTLYKNRIVSPQATGAQLRPTAKETPLSAPLWAELQSRMRPGNISELETLARRRGLPVVDGLQLATDAGQLWFAQMTDRKTNVTAWVITDSARRVAQARRLDGETWKGIDAKAKTLVTRGGDAAWPVGAPDIRTKPFAALVEGGPDFLAAWHFLWLCVREKEIAPIAMLGAGQRIHADALSLFAGKGVWTLLNNRK